MRPDPKVRRDGNCAGCGKPRNPEQSRLYARGQAELDPWCSATCCREYHGTTLPANQQHGPAAKPPVCGTAMGYKSGCKCDACLGYMRDSQRRLRARAAA